MVYILQVLDYLCSISLELKHHIDIIWKLDYVLSTVIKKRKKPLSAFSRRLQLLEVMKNINLTENNMR